VTGATFAAGLHAARAEHRSTDVNGRPIDPTAETETQRTERIRALQERWVPRDLPSAEPGAVLSEWMAASPANRMSAFAMRLAENAVEMMPQAESEPGPGESPRPGGLLERMAAQRAERTRQSRRNLDR
jgi:hypothetical protein